MMESYIWQLNRTIYVPRHILLNVVYDTHTIDGISHASNFCKFHCTIKQFWKPVWPITGGIQRLSWTSLFHYSCRTSEKYLKLSYSFINHCELFNHAISGVKWGILPVFIRVFAQRRNNLEYLWLLNLVITWSRTSARHCHFKR